MLYILSSFVFIFLNKAEAQELKCISGKIAQVEFGQEKIEKLQYCFNEEKTILLSKNCQTKKCSAFDYPYKFKIDQLLSEMGKPSFKLCREIGGKPELLEFYVDNKPYKLDRCLFNDGSFVDTDFLLSYYLER